jgi:hypothetical protein
MIVNFTEKQTTEPARTPMFVQAEFVYVKIFAKVQGVWYNHKKGVMRNDVSIYDFKR